MGNKFLLVLEVVLFLCVCPAFGAIHFRDGLTHDIYYEIDEDVWVDHETPEMYTTVNWLDGANTSFIFGHENSKINILGGSVYLLGCIDSCQVNISGGSITFVLSSGGSSRVDISGGSIGSIGGWLELWEQSMIQIFGYDFAVDGMPFGYGELTSIYGGDPWGEPLRHLTGTLQSGELIDNDFYIGHDARIVLIPEPATLLLLGLGSLALLKKRKIFL